MPPMVLETSLNTGHMEPQKETYDKAPKQYPAQPYLSHISFSLSNSISLPPLFSYLLLATFFHSFFVSFCSYPLLLPYLRGQQSLKPIWH